MKNLITFLIILIYSVSNAQGKLAVIKDKDGFTNVRSKPDSTSDVIYQLKENIVFSFDAEVFYQSKTAWITVWVPKNKYTLQCSFDQLSGYVHRSRIQPLPKLEHYSDTDFTFTYNSKPFSKKDKIIDYNKENYITSINGLYPWGAFGKTPKTEVEGIKINLKGNEIPISKVLYADLFNRSNKFIIYKNENTFLVYQGDDKIEMVWVINEKAVIQRYIEELY